MEENIKYAKLFDIYGELLTKKQQNIFKLYFMSDLSLREIAENMNITHQAVKDSLDKSKKILDNYEEKVGMLKYKKEVEKILNNK